MTDQQYRDIPPALSEHVQNAARQLKENRTQAEVISRAQKGSAADVIALASELHRLPGSMIPDAIDAACSHLEKTTEGAEVGPSTYELTVVRLIPTIGSLQDGLNLAVSPSDGLVSTMRRNWPVLLKAMHHLHDYILVEEWFKSIYSESDSLSAIVTILVGVGSSPWLMLALLRNTSAVTLAAKIWLSVDPSRTLRELQRNASFALARCLVANHGVSTITSLNAVVEAAHGNAEKVCDRAIQQIRSASKANMEVHANRADAAVKVDLIYRLSACVEHPLHSLLVQKRIMSSVTKTMSILSRYPHDDDSHRQAVGEYFQFCSDALHNESGTRWAIEASQHGLFEIYLNCSSSFSSLDHEDVEAAKVMLRIVLPKFLVFHSVLTAFAVAFKNLSPEKVMAVSESAVGAEWELFLQLFEERSVVKWIVDGFLSPPPMKLIKCSSCKKVDGKRTFQRCANCKSTFYCSQLCQKNHWRDGQHRGECDSLAWQKDLMPGFNESDRQYIDYLAALDIKRHYHSLAVMASKKYPGSDVRTMGFRANYTAVPIMLEPFPYKKALLDRVREGTVKVNDAGQLRAMAERCAGEVMMEIHYVSGASRLLSYAVSRSGDRMRQFDHIGCSAEDEVPTRSCGLDYNDNCLVPHPDEIDQVIMRAREAERSKRDPQLRQRRLWEYIDEIDERLRTDPYAVLD